MLAPSMQRIHPGGYQWSPPPIGRIFEFVCIFHRCMPMGILLVVCLESQVQIHPPEIGTQEQKILYWARCGVKLGSEAALDREETHKLFRPYTRF